MWLSQRTFYSPGEHCHSDLCCCILWNCIQQWVLNCLFHWPPFWSSILYHPMFSFKVPHIYEENAESAAKAEKKMKKIIPFSYHYSRRNSRRERGILREKKYITVWLEREYRLRERRTLKIPMLPNYYSTLPFICLKCALFGSILWCVCIYLYQCNNIT